MTPAGEPGPKVLFTMAVATFSLRVSTTPTPLPSILKWHWHTLMSNCLAASCQVREEQLLMNESVLGTTKFAT